MGQQTNLTPRIDATLEGRHQAWLWKTMLAEEMQRKMQSCLRIAVGKNVLLILSTSKNRPLSTTHLTETTRMTTRKMIWTWTFGAPRDDDAKVRTGYETTRQRR